MAPELVLYSYFRSSAAYRVRIALNIKNVPYKIVPVHMLRDGGEHKQARYAAINPQARVPALVVEEAGHRKTLVQSLAIIEWLEERYPNPPLLPYDAASRARVRAIAALVACDVHPLNNLSVLNYLKEHFGVAQPEIDRWYAHWICEGFRAIEQLITGHSFAVGAQAGLAEIHLIPQIFNARRFKVPLEEFPNILKIEERCATIPSFVAAHPANQPDAV